MRKSRWTAALVASLVIMAMIAGPALAAGSVTVGSFLQQLARAKNLNASDARIAADSLRAVGVQVPADLDLDKRLTEADVADLARRAGLRVTTTQPDAPFSDEQVDRFFSSFAAELQPIDRDDSNSTADDDGDGDGPGFDPATKGKGHHKGKGKRTPTEPE